MVKLNKIYTRTGDGGETSLVNGRRVAKHSGRPAAFGEVDEANSVIGLARLHCEGESDEMLGRIQNDLFDLGADLATPESDSPALRITEDQVNRLETEIDAMNADLQPLTSFILPGGSQAAAWLHLARTVTRRRAQDDRAGERGSAERTGPALYQPAVRPPVCSGPHLE